jgi:hypothetical protein
MTNFWKKLSEQKPISTQSGQWDGLKSEQILCCDDKGFFFVAICYQGVMDGNEFCNFYDENDFDVENVVYWAEIPPVG